MSSKLSAPGSRKRGKIQKNDITRGLFSKTKKRVLLTLQYSVCFPEKSVTQFPFLEQGQSNAPLI